MPTLRTPAVPTAGADLRLLAGLCVPVGVGAGPAAVWAAADGRVWCYLLKTPWQGRRSGGMRTLLFCGDLHSTCGARAAGTPTTCVTSLPWLCAHANNLLAFCVSRVPGEWLVHRSDLRGTPRGMPTNREGSLARVQLSLSLLGSPPPPPRFPCCWHHSPWPLRCSL